MNNVSLNCNNFFDKYYVHPLSDDLSTRSKVIVSIATVVLFVLTAGLFHLINYARLSWSGQPVVQEAAGAGAPPLPSSATAAVPPTHTSSPAISEDDNEVVDAPSEPIEETDSLTQLFHDEKLPPEDLETFRAYPLHYAAQKNLQPLVHVLTEKNEIDIYAQNKEGKTAYQLTDSVQIKKLLIEKAGVCTSFSDDLLLILFTAPLEKYSVLKKLGFDFNVQDANTGKTALHWAAELERPELIKPLVQLGVDIDAKDRNNKTAMDCARGKNDIQTVIELIRQGADITGPFHNVIDGKILQALLLATQLLNPIALESFTNMWIEGILSLPEAKRREIYQSHPHCAERGSRFMTGVIASLPECLKGIQDNFEVWSASSLILSWIIRTWEMMTEFDAFYDILAPLSPQDVLRVLPHCSTYTRERILQRKQGELLSQCDEEKEELFEERFAQLLSQVHMDAPVEQLKDVRKQLYALQLEINQIVSTLRPWTPEGNELTSGLNEEELAIIVALVSKATWLQETLSSPIKTTIENIEKYLPKEAPPPTVAEEADEDYISFLGKWDGEFFLPDFFPKKITEALGCLPEELSKRGIAEGRDCHLLGLTNELRYLIDEADTTRDLGKIQQWWEREKEKLIAIRAVVSKNHPESMGVTTSSHFFDLLSKDDTIDPEKISGYLKFLKNMDKAFKTFCLRSYLAQEGLEKMFAEGNKSLTEFFAAEDVQPTRLYNLSPQR